MTAPETRCAICGKEQGLSLCARCGLGAYCGREHQLEHWPVHKKYCKYIPGTKVKRDVEPGSDPLDPSIQRDRRWGSGQSLRDPVLQYMHFKYEKDGSHRVRLCYPGSLTPYIMNASVAEQRARGFSRSDHISTPFEEQGDKKVKLPSGRYRHIADFTVKELRQLGWDGSMTVSTTCNHEYVPFVCGYDSDKDDTYEPVDIASGKQRGVIGLPPGSGLFSEVGGKRVEINPRLVRRR